MNAFVIEYNPDSTHVALGWYTGQVDIHSVNPADGSPAQKLVSIFHHKHEIVLIQYRGEHLLIVDSSGHVTLSEQENGSLLKEYRFNGEYARGAVSPSENYLHMFVYESNGRDESLFRLDLNSFQEAGVISEKYLGTGNKLFAPSDDIVWMHYVKDDWDLEPRLTRQGILEGNFSTDKVQTRFFGAGPESDFSSGTEPFDINVRHNIGIRLDYDSPVEYVMEGEEEFAVLKVQAFDPKTLQVLGSYAVLRFNAAAIEEDEEMRILREPSDTEAYREALSKFFREVCTLKLEASGDVFWMSIRNGLVRPFHLKENRRGCLVSHGGEMKTVGGFTLDDVFARNLANNHTLGVSPDGRYVGFGNPNDFFNAEAQGVFGELRVIELPLRGGDDASGEGRTETPDFAGFSDDGVAITIAKEDTFFAFSVADGAKLLELDGVGYGEIIDIARSPSGRKWLFGMSGDGAHVAMPSDETGETEVFATGYPPHSVLARFMSEEEMLLVHHNGAVSLLDEQGIVTFREGDDDYEEEEEDNQEMDGEEEDGGESGGEDEQQEEEGDFEDDEYLDFRHFEQRDPVYGSDHFRQGDTDWVAVNVESSQINIYTIQNREIKLAYSFDKADHLSYRTRVAACGGLGGGRLAVYDKDTVQLYALMPDQAYPIFTVSKPGLSQIWLHPEGMAMYLFSNDTGILSRLDMLTMQEQNVLKYTGASVNAVDYSWKHNKLLICEGDGTVVQIDVAAGKPDFALTLKATGEGRAVSLNETPDTRVALL